MKIHKYLLALLTCVTAVPMLLATGAAAQDTRQKINLYTAFPESLSTPLTAAFEKLHPEYEIVTTRLVAGALSTRIYNEASVGLNQADVVITTASDLFDKYPQWFRDLSDMPAYQGWPDQFKAKTYVKALIQVVSIYYNTNSVTKEEAPKTWQDLLNPRWSSGAVMLDPSASPTYMSWALNMRKAFGDQFLAALSAQKPTIVGGVLDAAQMVASGAADIAFPGSPVTALDLKKQGAPIDVVNVDAPTLGSETSIALAAVSPDPEGAKVFFEWFLSPTGGLTFVCPNWYVAGPPVAGCDPLPKDYVSTIFDVPEDVAQDVIKLLLPK